MNVNQMIEQLRQIPEDARRFHCNESYARLHFGLDHETLGKLVDEGLPCARADRELCFEYGDLHYVGLRLGFGSTFLWAIRGWVASLELFARRSETRVAVAYLPQLGTELGPTTGMVRLPGGECRKVSLENGKPAVEVKVSQRGGWPALPSAAASIVADVADSISFCLLPVVLRGDTCLARRIGLADCLTSAHLIVEEWRDAGLEARVASGLLISLPYSTIHNWAELRIDDEWIPVDPLTLSLMRDFGELDGNGWPAHRSVGPLVARVGECPGTLIEAGDHEIPATFLTSRLDGEAP